MAGMVELLSTRAWTQARNRSFGKETAQRHIRPGRLGGGAARLSRGSTWALAAGCGTRA